MKKFLLVSMIVATAICSYAADLKITGDAYVKGNWIQNSALAEEDEKGYGYYDYDFNLYAAIVINEQASVNFKLTYDKAYVAGGNTKGEAGKNGTGEYLSVEYAYIKYKFNTGTIVDFGMMSGGTWATKFGETESPAMRIKVTQVVAPELTLLAIIQKSQENGAAKSGVYVTSADGTTSVDNESNDNDTYYLAAILNLGPIAIKPLLVYGRDGNNQEYNHANEAYLKQTYSGQLGIDINLDPIGLESEFQYTKIDMDGGADGITPDTKTYAGYVNVWMKMDPIKVGVAGAYASADEIDGTASMGQDFNFCIVVDEVLSEIAGGVSGFTIGKVYAEVKLDPVTIGVAGLYGYNNRDWDTSTQSKDAAFTEFDAFITFALDANVSYTIDGGYAMLSDWSVKGHDADVYAIRHKLAAKF
jgi:hypothetical protein